MTQDAAAPDGAVGAVVTPPRVPELPEGWTYRFTARAMGDARIDLCDRRGRAVATAAFPGHAGSPPFVLAAACGRAYAEWQASGGMTVDLVHAFTASLAPEGGRWRAWCNQALDVTFLVDDPADAAALMTDALARARGLDPADVAVTIVGDR